jgi:ATP-binding cassette subfamily C protein
MLSFFLSRYRTRTVWMIALLCVAGLLEGVSFAAILPVLQFATGGAPEQDGLSGAIAVALGFIGLQPTLGVLLGVLVALIATKALVLLIAMQSVGFVVARVALELRLRLFEAVAHAEWRHLLQYPTGFITNAVSSEAHIVSSAYREFCGALADAVQVVAYLTLVLLISWRGALLAVLVGGGILFLLRKLVWKVGEAGRLQVISMRDILSRMTDVIPGLKPLKAMGREGYFLPLLEVDVLRFFEAQRSQISSSEILAKAGEPIVVLAMAGGLWATLTYSDLSFAAVMVMALLFYRAVTQISKIQRRWTSVAVGESAFESFMQHISEAEARRETWSGTDPAPALREALTFEDVSFSYGEHPVLDGVNLTLEAGTFVLLTGPSGGGKSTLIDLITGLLRPASGTVKLDGVDLADVDMKAWRSRIGYVPQELLLLSASVRENLTLGDPEISTDRVIKALKMANAWEFVSRLSGGIDQKVGEGGTTLSGGQKQRISIARALVGDPRLLVLDEPTTALDSKSEEEVLESIRSLRGHLTVLAVSHQAALRSCADEVWNLIDGSIQSLES